MMNTLIKSGAAVATLLAVATMAATPSEARCRGCGAAAAGFVAGAAVGAVAANSYYGGYYGPGYGYGYGYAPGYAYYGGPAYDSYAYAPGYDSYAYAPAYGRRLQSLPEYRDGTGRVAGSNALMDR
jgi:hypothetical protein